MKSNQWKMRSILCIIILAFLTPPAFIVRWLYQAMESNRNPEVGEHFTTVDWLPSSATDVCFFKSYSATAYEFNISESEFIKWIDDKNVEEIKDPVELPRYKAHKDEMNGSGISGNYERVENGGNLHSVRITQGLYMRTPIRGNGGGTFWAYDRVKSRAYYAHYPR